MRKLIFVAAIAAATVAVPAFAQDATGQDTTGQYAATQDTASDAPTAPDGTKAFGIEPYFGIMGGYERFDNEPTHSGIPLHAGHDYDGGLVQGVVGVNVPLGPVFVGAEGNAIKGFKGDIDWEYGAAGRFGFRAGDSGMIYGKVGYQWVNFAALGKDSKDYGEMTYGIGAEVGPKDIGLSGITGNAGVRLRLEVDTYGDAHSFRPMAGVITHF
ncbi:opacity protein [Sphingomonas koreensis]|nr:opacity protein [Sphingomonas koreensis]